MIFTFRVGPERAFDKHAHVGVVALGSVGSGADKECVVTAMWIAVALLLCTLGVLDGAIFAFSSDLTSSSVQLELPKRMRK